MYGESPTEELLTEWGRSPNWPSVPLVLVWQWGDTLHVFDTDLGYRLPVTGGLNHPLYGRVTGWNCDDLERLAAWIGKLDAKHRAGNRNVCLVQGKPISWDD